MIAAAMQRDLHLDPDWLVDPSWEEVARRADRLTSDEAAAAMAKLREVYPPEWASTCTLDHAIAGKQRTYPGRLSLLELGHAAVLTGIDNAFADRLRNPGEYFGADAELRAALLLMQSGATLDRSPKGEGSRRSE